MTVRPCSVAVASASSSGAPYPIVYLVGLARLLLNPGGKGSSTSGKPSCVGLSTSRFLQARFCVSTYQAQDVPDDHHSGIPLCTYPVEKVMPWTAEKVPKSGVAFGCPMRSLSRIAGGYSPCAGGPTGMT